MRVIVILSLLALLVALSGCATAPAVGCFGYADASGQRQLQCGVRIPT
jgi:hypothetical protein